MKHHQLDPDDLDPEFDELPEGIAPHIEHLSRKWAQDEARHSRHPRHGPTRRRIEDWREERELQRQFDADLDLD